MQACPLDHPALPSLFDPQVPDNPVLWSVFKGYHSGKAFVDNIDHPSQCVVRTDAFLTFCSSLISQSFLNQAIAHFRRVDSVWLVWPSAYASRLLAPITTCVNQRIEFYGYDPGSPVLANWRQRLPDGFDIRPIDRQIIERCEWRDEMVFYCGSLENFLANEFGLCLMQKDNIIVEAYVSSFGEKQAEIGAVTHEMYRGHGYAPITCAYLIEACEQRGYHSYWSCDAENIASVQVARKLGFQHEQAYQILEYSPQSQKD
jgi:RimJ/RimL family protein N-acetyltransferase